MIERNIETISETPGFNLESELAKVWGKNIPAGAEAMVDFIKSMPKVTEPGLELGIEGHKIPALSVVNGLEAYADEIRKNRLSRRKDKPETVHMSPVLEAATLDLFIQNGLEKQEFEVQYKNRIQQLTPIVTLNDPVPVTFKSVFKDVREKAKRSTEEVRANVQGKAKIIRELGDEIADSLSISMRNAVGSVKEGIQEGKDKKERHRLLDNFVDQLAEGLTVVESRFRDGGMEHPDPNFSASVDQLIQKGWLKQVDFSDRKVAIDPRPDEAVVTDIAFRNGKTVHLDSSELDQKLPKSVNQMLPFETVLYSVCSQEAILKAAVASTESTYRVSIEGEARRRGVDLTSGSEKRGGEIELVSEKLKIDVLRELREAMIDGKIDRARPGTNLTVNDLRKHTEGIITRKGIVEGTLAFALVTQSIMTACGGVAPTQSVEVPIPPDSQGEQIQIDLQKQMVDKNFYGGSNLDGDDIRSEIPSVEFANSIKNDVLNAMSVGGHLSGEVNMTVGQFTDGDNDKEPIVLVSNQYPDGTGGLFFYTSVDQTNLKLVPAGQGNGGFVRQLYLEPAGVGPNGQAIFNMGFAGSETDVKIAMPLFQISIDPDGKWGSTIYYSPYSKQSITIDGAPEWMPDIDFIQASYNPNQEAQPVKTSTPEVVVPTAIATEAPVGPSEEVLNQILLEAGISFSPDTTNEILDADGNDRCSFRYSNGVLTNSQINYIQYPEAVKDYMCYNVWGKLMMLQRTNAPFLTEEFDKFPVLASEQTMSIQSEMRSSAKKVLDENKQIPFTYWNLNGEPRTNDVSGIELNHVSKEEYQKLKQSLDSQNVDYFTFPPYELTEEDNKWNAPDINNIVFVKGKQIVVYMYNFGGKMDNAPGGIIDPSWGHTTLEQLGPKEREYMFSALIEDYIASVLTLKLSMISADQVGARWGEFDVNELFDNVFGVNEAERKANANETLSPLYKPTPTP